MTYVTDPIGDLMIRIKNAGMVGKEYVNVPYSKFKHAVVDALLRAGFVESVEKEGRGVNKTLIIKLKYKDSGKPRISSVKRISKPGRRMYKKASEIFPVKYGYGIAVYSTPKGVLTNEEARKENVGGEILFEVF